MVENFLSPIRKAVSYSRERAENQPQSNDTVFFPFSFIIPVETGGGKLRK